MEKFIVLDGYFYCDDGNTLQKVGVNLLVKGYIAFKESNRL